MTMMKNIWKPNFIQITSKTIEVPSIMIVVRAVFHENNLHYPQVFCDEGLYKL